MSVQIHRCRFMDCERPGVSSIAFNYPSVGPKSYAPSDLRFAVGRMNGDIEIWNPHYWNCDLIIPGAEGRTIEDLAWVCDAETSQFRLFTVGGSDTIVEWDLSTGIPSQMIRSDAGVVWALSVSPNGRQIAAATELGTIVIYEVTHNQIEPVKRLGGAGTSLASLAWKSESEIVAGGSDGRLRVWSIPHNRITSTLRVDKTRSRQKNSGSSHASQEDDGEETVVWALLNLPHTHQLASGDSNGFIKIWDTRNWTLLQSFAAHEADVLCLAANWDGTALFSSGLDQKIVQTKLTDFKLQRWSVMNSSVAHTHDIRSLASFEASGADFSLLLSGGLEPAFVVNNIEQLQSGVESYRRVISRGKSQAAAAGNFVVEWNERQAQVWLITPEPNTNGRRLIARAKIADEYITSCSFDPEQGLLACGSLLKTRVFKISEGDKGIHQIELVKNSDIGVRYLSFVESERLICATVEDEVVLQDVSDSSEENASKVIVESQNDEDNTITNKLLYANQISLLAVNKGLIAVTRHNGRIDIYTLIGKHVCKLPTLPSTVTALHFRNSDKLVVCTADRAVFEFDAVKGSLTQWSRLNTSNKMPKTLLNQSEPALGIFNDVNNASRVWIWGASWLATVDFSSTLPIRNDSAQGAVVDGDSDGLPHFYITNRFKPLFFAGDVSNSIVVSERPEKAEDAQRFWSNRRILFA